MVKTLNVAAVQPKTFKGAKEPENISEALGYINKAKQMGAQIVCFPEGYPGPYSSGKLFDTLTPLCAKAKETSMYVIAGSVEEAPGDLYYNVLTLIGSNGEVVGRYRRVQPPPPHVDEVLFSKKVLPGDELKVFQTPIGNIGLLICSEVFSPELSRIMALKGADVVFYPVGGMLYELMDRWKIMVQARAVENHFYTVVCQNLYGMEDGIATIASPEGILAQSFGEGLITASLNLDRLRWLREHDETLDLPKAYKTIPGLLRWRRPEMYGDITKLEW